MNEISTNAKLHEMVFSDSPKGEIHVQYVQLGFKSKICSPIELEKLYLDHWNLDLTVCIPVEYEFHYKYAIGDVR